MLFYKNKVIGWYQEAVTLKQIDSDLKSALRTQERVPQFIINLSSEFQKVQDYRLKKGKPMVDENTLRETVYDFVDVFIAGLVKSKELEQESMLKKLVREREIQDQKDLEATAQGKKQGIFEEIEMEFVNDRESKEEKELRRASTEAN